MRSVTERAIVALAVASLTAAACTPVTAAAPPACVHRMLASERADPSSSWPPPRVVPAAGRAQDEIVVEGSGAPPGASVTLVALYAENGCVIAGSGDQLLGTTRAEADGSYALRRRWPAAFEPLLGRGGFQPTPLPPGRYFLVAVPCSMPRACSLSAASSPGGPFLLRARSPSGGIVTSGAAAGVIARAVTRR